MGYLPLLGIVVVGAGFLLRLRVTIVVVAAGFVTGLAAGMPLVGSGPTPGIIDTLGTAFANGRIITLFVLSLPAIGLCERYGLQEEARRVILRIPAVTVGGLQLVYQLFRVVVVGLGIRLGSGHVSFSRPLVLPMALGAAGLEAVRDAATEDVERVKAATAASENYGNFFGQNLFFGASGVALVVATLKDNALAADPRGIARWSVPIAVVSLVVAAIQFAWLDRWLTRRAARRQRGPA
jgi:uncharacterized membrane protein